MMMRHVPRGGGPQTAQITNGYSNSVHRNIANTANTTPATTYYMYTVIRIITGCAISLFLISTIAMHFMVQDIMNDQVQSRGIVEHNIQKEEAAHDTTRRRKKLERKTHQKGHGDHRNKVAPAVDFIPDGEQDANNNNVINNDAFVTTDVWKKHPGIEQPSGKILSTLQEYIDLRETYDAILPDDAGAEARRLTYARTEARVRSYKPILLEDLDTTNGGGGMSYDPLNCPDEPPDGYPHTWNVMDVIGHWSPDDPTPHNEIHQGICVFQYATDIDKIFSYRRAEVPYVVRDDPQVLKTVERWGHADYLKEMLQNKKQMTEHSENNHFMYWKEPKRGNKKPHGWEPPTEMTSMGYLDWLKKADGPESDLLTDKEHWYYRLNSPPLHHQLSGGHKKGKINALRGDKEKKKKGNDFVLLYDELAFFQPHHNLYLVNPEDERGINCRFGMKGVIAENHYDGSRNSIALMLGERRYILAGPGQCSKLALYPMGHPSGRHSAVDWSDPDLKKYPQFQHAQVNEIVLQAGDVLYLPMNWFHYIISLNRNYQCNIRSGVNIAKRHNARLLDPIKACGF